MSDTDGVVQWIVRTETAHMVLGLHVDRVVELEIFKEDKEQVDSQEYRTDGQDLGQH